MVYLMIHTRTKDVKRVVHTVAYARSFLPADADCWAPITSLQGAQLVPVLTDFHDHAPYDDANVPSQTPLPQ